MVSSALLTSKNENWETPKSYFDELNQKYNFTFDLAASDDDHKTPCYYTVSDDSLSKPWHELPGNLFLNPPYGRQLKLWIKKAYEESLLKTDGSIVVLIPSRTDTSYWHDYIFGKANITFIRGRLKFELDGISGDAAPFPSALVVFE